MTASRQELHQRVAILANTRRLRSVFGVWKRRLKGKRLTEWRRDMRNRMKLVREKQSGKLRKDAWAKWRQSYRSHLSGQRYTERLLFQFFQRWKAKLSEVDHLDAVGDGFLHASEERAAQRLWTYWKRAMEIRNAERATRDMVGLRVMEKVMTTWKSRT
jgi:protein SFI1